MSTPELEMLHRHYNGDGSARIGVPSSAAVDDRCDDCKAAGRTFCGCDVTGDCPAGGKHRWVWQPAEMDLTHVGFWCCDECSEQPSTEEVARWADV